MKKILFFILLISFTGCSGLIKTINGEKKPQIENMNSLEEFVYENDLSIDFEKNLFLKNRKSLELLTESDLCYVDNDSTIIAYGTMLFTKNWEGINYQDAQACLIDQIKEDRLINENETIFSKTAYNPYNLSDFQAVFSDINGHGKSPFQKNEQPVAIVVWAKYKGKRWAGYTEDIIKQLKESREYYDIYFLNGDPNHNF